MKIKFKIGDKVRITRNGNKSIDAKNNIGKEFIIKQVVKSGMNDNDSYIGGYKDQGISINYSETGIWLSSLELVDKSIDLLAEAKIRYPIGTKVKCLKYGDILTVDSYANRCQTYDAFWVVSNDQRNLCVFSNGVWAEIISTPVTLTSKEILELNNKPLLMSLPSKWCIKDCIEVSKYAANRWQCAASVNHNSFYHEGDTDIFKNYTFSNKIEWGYTEITFEQFKKWVLKEPLGLNEYAFNKKYTIAELKANKNLVVRCISIDQGIKLGKLLWSEGRKINWNHYNFSSNFIIWSSYSSWNNFNDLSVEQTVVEFNDVIFDNDVKPVKSWYETEIENIAKTFTAPSLGLKEYPVWSNKMSTERDHLWTIEIDPYNIKSNNLEFQQPVIIKSNKKNKFKLTIINQ